MFRKNHLAKIWFNKTAWNLKIFPTWALKIAFINATIDGQKKPEKRNLKIVDAKC
jgi:hypothetical protein